MPLPSGQIADSDINTEIGVASTTTRTLNDTVVRTMANIPTGAIAMSNLQSKEYCLSTQMFYDNNGFFQMSWTPCGGGSGSFQDLHGAYGELFDTICLRNSGNSLAVTITFGTVTPGAQCHI